MNRRIKSMELMKLLQPYIQSGVLIASDAKNMIEEYVKGNDEQVRQFIMSPEIPMMLKNITKEIKNFIQ